MPKEPKKFEPAKPVEKVESAPPPPETTRAENLPPDHGAEELPKTQDPSLAEISKNADINAPVASGVPAGEVMPVLTTGNVGATVANAPGTEDPGPIRQKKDLKGYKGIL